MTHTNIINERGDQTMDKWNKMDNAYNQSNHDMNKVANQLQNDLLENIDMGLSLGLTNMFKNRL